MISLAVSRLCRTSVLNQLAQDAVRIGVEDRRAPRPAPRRITLSTVGLNKRIVQANINVFVQANARLRSAGNGRCSTRGGLLNM